jgi:hypothetical protein
MPLSAEEESELDQLLKKHALVARYPQHYPRHHNQDIYVDKRDKHDWHDGPEVRRMQDLINKKGVNYE